MADSESEYEDSLQRARDAMRRGDSAAAVAALAPFADSDRLDARGWQLYGFALRSEQLMPEALAAFARAEALEPDDALTATALAQTNLQCGLPAVASTARARQLDPTSPSLLLTMASALVADGRRAEAIELLERQLESTPGWLEGQYSLAELRWTGGDQDQYARGYERAHQREPGNLKLILAWFRFVAQARRWPEALRVIDLGERQFGPQAVFAVARALVAAESGDVARAEELFEATRSLTDEVRDLAYVRHCLRLRRPADAEVTALRLTHTGSATAAWPYLSLIWRLTGDRRAEWLDGAPPYVGAFDVQLTTGELEELAHLLRGLHTARAPYIEQSVRGGTQTERPIFFRTEPIIALAKARILDAIQEYTRRLPAPVAGHPLLGVPRQPVRFAGSWSVRLLRQGHNVPHTHPLGWISSAFYVSLPTAKEMGPEPAGWIRFGEAPSELGLELPAYAQIQPKVGRLVLFPSTMWHSTVPFANGERLVVAFDVRQPAALRQ